MENPIIENFGEMVHDNTIKGYSVDFVNETLQMVTENEDKKTILITFNGLLAHSFENVINCNIILDLYQLSIIDYVNENTDSINESLKYCFPSMKSRNSQELEKELIDNAYKLFEFNASIGLVGYVIAKNLTIEPGKR